MAEEKALMRPVVQMDAGVAALLKNDREQELLKRIHSQEDAGIPTSHLLAQDAKTLEPFGPLINELVRAGKSAAADNYRLSREHLLPLLSSLTQLFLRCKQSNVAEQKLPSPRDKAIDTMRGVIEQVIQLIYEDCPNFDLVENGLQSLKVSLGQIPSEPLDVARHLKAVNAEQKFRWKILGKEKPKRAQGKRKASEKSGSGKNTKKARHTE